MLHKRSLKLIKRRYKIGKGGSSTSVQPYILPPQHDKVKFKEIRDKVLVQKTEQEPKLAEVKLTDSA